MHTATLGTLLWMAAQLPAPAVAPAADCSDVYSHTDECVRLQQEAIDVPGDSVMNIADKAPDPLTTIDPDAVAWQLISAAAVPAIGAAAIHGVQLFYFRHARELAAQDALDHETFRELSLTQTALGYGAATLWFGSAMLVGTGIVFFVFDPSNGRLRPPLSTME